jgi:hypothetical protein
MEADGEDDAEEELAAAGGGRIKPEEMSLINKTRGGRGEGGMDARGERKDE